MRTLENLYKDVILKEPKEMEDYQETSNHAIQQIERIIQNRIDENRNQIKVMIDLKKGIPMNNIHKLAAPIVETWASEVFEEELENENYDLIGVEVAQGRLDFVDIILSFRKKNGNGFNAQVDVKATSEDIKTSGKSPNITSYIKIRSAYIEDPDLLFVILSLKHSVYSHNKKDRVEQFIVVKSVNAYDLKNVSENDFSINPALGSGQIQIKDIHYVETKQHTTWEFCKILDQKFIRCEINSKERWLAYAKKHGWIK